MERHITKKEDIIVLRIDNKDWNMSAIAREVGCSREYVRLVLKEAKLPTAVGNWASGKMKYHARKQGRKALATV